MPRRYVVYILASVSRRLYVGVTADIARRLEQHARRDPLTFVGRYRITRLVHVEVCARAHAAIEREKQLKGWSRRKKVALIVMDNPGWRDLRAEVLGSLMSG